MHSIGSAELWGAAALIRAIDAQEITYREFSEAIENFHPEGLQYISTILASRGIVRADASRLNRTSRELCRARAALLRCLS